MPRPLPSAVRRAAATVAAAVVAATVPSAATAAVTGPTLTTLVSFAAATGTGPDAGLTVDAAGNLYGTTSAGGAGGVGTVFSLTGPTHQTLTTLLAFNSTNGATPYAGLTLDPAGNLYGTTTAGGTANDGVVFRLAGPAHQAVTTLATFTGTNGRAPFGGVAVDPAGDLFGTTRAGGANGFGTVFELPAATATAAPQAPVTLLSLGTATGVGPLSTPAIDPAGNLYVTTFTSGPNRAGTVLQLSGPAFQQATVLAAFAGPNGGNLSAGVIVDPAGNLFGTAFNGGANSGGTVFQLTGAVPQTPTTLVDLPFNATVRGGSEAALLADAAGDLFGTTYSDGTAGQGTVFELAGPDHRTLTTLATFAGSNGANPVAGLVADAAGNLYGTTFGGGGASNAGTVFELTGTGFVVPEPAAAGLLAAVAAGLLGRRRRRRSGTLPE